VIPVGPEVGRFERIALRVLDTIARAAASGRTEAV